ncbi:hypothetical protein PHLGIDRAFT_150610 [Phlebiopsis gigantea 11061_1 CR5-6]|uniref:Uncharacterized protein n=1 Tax=Phlebiopsis gigantea (strain 11061_1 CR5-6) TaxID=745531 RepID=A0A0C3NKC2_PHLG1|nr:hypothetical protein PHLGIDRAFT_150610 [Phlebiopsis gigantea 11061_1 CR5-6]
MTVCELSNTASTCNNSFSVPLLQHNLAGSVGSVGISHNDATPPVPCSTLFPSSAGHTPPSTLPRTSTPPTCMTEEDLVECAREYAAFNVKPASGEWGVSSVPTTRALGIILGSVLSLPAAVKSDTSTPHSAQDSSRTSSAFCPDIYRRAKGQPYALNTQDAQTQFTRELDGLLRQVQLEQRRLKADFTSSVSRSHSQESSSSSRFSLSTSSSVYAADISLGHSTACSSASSFSASTHLSRSHSSTPSAVSGDNFASHSDHSDDSPKGLEFANTPMAARFVYGSISDETDGAEIDLAEAEPGNGEQQTQLGSEDVVEDLVRPSTPSSAHNLATPGAPKKNRSHFYLTNVNAASSRKRPRVMSITDSPQQDRSPSGGYMRARPSSCTPGEAQTPPDSTVSPKARITGSDVSPKRARLSYDVSRSNSSGHTQVKLLAREPASFRRAASLRSEPSAKLLSIAELKKKPAVAAVICSKSASNASLEGNPDSGEYPPTQPVTPVSQSPHIPSSASGSPFPILSPSALGPMPTRRLMDAEVAESRIRILVRKELAARVSDGLLSAREDTGDISIDPCATVDSDQEMWTALGETVSNGEIKASKVGIRQQQSEDQPATPSLTEVPLTLGIEEEFRVRVVEWILDVSRT